ncbi:MAG TPA: HU family DNA-binding protein [Beutenbergiaceae bacterium]|nr:HU family DNA-binding protein [Beutenbergiaceae bacterium]
MNKSELANAVAEKTNLSNKDAAAAVNAVLSIIEETLANGNKIALTGFGTFETRKRAARIGVKPGTSERIEIPASTYPAFKPGKNLKDAVNK